MTGIDRLSRRNRRRAPISAVLLYMASSSMPVSDVHCVVLLSPSKLQHHAPTSDKPRTLAVPPSSRRISLPDLLEKHSLGQPPLLGGAGSGEEGDDEFNLNLGRALDYLAQDVPQMFAAPPRLEIFTQGVVLKDPVGELCHGRRLYGALHTSLRVLSAVTAATPRVGVSSIAFNKDKREVELKWTMIASAPLIGGDAVKISAVSMYRINEHGLIYEHAIDNRIKRDLWEYSHSWMGVLVSGYRPPST